MSEMMWDEIEMMLKNEFAQMRQGETVEGLW